MKKEDAIDYLAFVSSSLKSLQREADKVIRQLAFEFSDDYIPEDIDVEAAEKIWRSTWIGEDSYTPITVEMGYPSGSCYCKKCGHSFAQDVELYNIGFFCPECGSAMTDDAMNMVLQRLMKTYKQIRESKENKGTTESN